MPGAMVLPLRLFVRCAGVLFLLGTFAAPLRADNPPKFKDPAVAAYFQQLSDILDGLLTAVKAKDDAKVKEWTDKFLVASKNDDTLRSKISSEEDAAAAKWGAAQMQKLSDAGWVPRP